MTDYQQVIATLRTAYNRRSAERRDKEGKTAWKIEERQSFLSLLQHEGKTTLLEVGAGTGVDSLFFQEHGLRVICTDLSPDMIYFCRAKGLEAYVMDFLSLDFPAASFDAIYSVNCLLHVPTQNLPAVLQKLRDLLRPGGLFFLGVYGGIEKEGVSEQDWHVPPRFYAYHTDEFMQRITAQYFDLVSFKAIPLEDASLRHDTMHFQSLVLRRKEPI